jgi:hypothetical protein
MEKNEIKKALYRFNPTAYMQYVRKGKIYYYCIIPVSDCKDCPSKEDVPSSEVRFEVPVSDIGDADFYSEMDAKLLIRWIV